jgi:hypothetical protein
MRVCTSDDEVRSVASCKGKCPPVTTISLSCCLIHNYLLCHAVAVAIVNVRLTEIARLVHIDGFGDDTRCLSSLVKLLGPKCKCYRLLPSQMMFWHEEADVQSMERG